MQEIGKKEKNRNSGEGFEAKAARLGPSLLFKGEISGEENLVIEGQVQGKIDLRNHNLIIEKEAKVEAEIRARNITIKGEVSGNIYASEMVLISTEGQMKGDICASRISIMDGAHFKGSIKMGEEKAPD